MWKVFKLLRFWKNGDGTKIALKEIAVADNKVTIVEKKSKLTSFDLNIKPLAERL